jgi:hypothetical protein
VADGYLVAVSVLGGLFVAGFLAAGATPPRWTLGVALILVVGALAAVLNSTHASRR